MAAQRGSPRWQGMRHVRRLSGDGDDPQHLAGIDTGVNPPGLWFCAVSTYLCFKALRPVGWRKNSEIL